jgi:hypothetical protein
MFLILLSILCNSYVFRKLPERMERLASALFFLFAFIRFFSANACRERGGFFFVRCIPGLRLGPLRFQQLDPHTWVWSWSVDVVGQGGGHQSIRMCLRLDKLALPFGGARVMV